MRIKSYKRFLMTLALLAVVIYLIALGVSRVFMEAQTYKAVYGKHDVEKSSRAIVLRQETLVNAGLSGTVEWFVKEGDKVNKTQRIAAVLVSDNKLVTSEQTQAISNLKSHEMLKIDLTKVDKEIEVLRKEVYTASAASNFKRLKELQRDLMLKMDRRKKLVDSQSMLEDSVSSFKRVSLTANDAQVGKRIDLNSPETGLVTYQTDGFEDSVTLDNLYNLDYDLIFASKQTPGVWGSAQVKSGEPLVKIVDSENWYMLCMIERDDLDSYEKNKEIGIKIDDKVYAGKVNDVFENNQKGVLVVKMIDQYDKFYTQRFLEVRVVSANYQGLKINKDSIITVNGVQGVYIADSDFKAIFRPVKILGYDESYAIIKPGYITVIENGSPKRIKTVDVNSSVVADPSNVRAGDTLH